MSARVVAFVETGETIGVSLLPRGTEIAAHKTIAVLFASRTRPRNLRRKTINLMSKRRILSHKPNLRLENGL